MPPDREECRPRREGGTQDDAANVPTIVTGASVTGCPCGCASRPPFTDDPGCLRHRPLPEALEWPGYDIRALGIEPHDRAACARCQAVAS
jgi:hypothetical protein